MIIEFQNPRPVLISPKVHQPAATGSVLIIGCGYVGRALALDLAHEGRSVTAWVRTSASAAALRNDGLDALAADVADPLPWRRLPPNLDLVVFCAATRGGSPDDYRRVYLDGMRRAVEYRPASSHLVFTSSTSVYGQDDGSWVDESSAAQPAAETARVLLEAEALCLAAGGAVARVAGIYGPGRSGPLRLLRSGQARIEPGGGRWINQVHRDDVASALRFLGERRIAGIFNVCDDGPCRQDEFYTWLCGRIDLPVPPVAPALPGRRAATSKRVSNRKLRALGWAPRVPSFIEGYERLLRAG